MVMFNSYVSLPEGCKDMKSIPMDPGTVPSERKWDWGIIYYNLEVFLYLLRQWPWIHRDIKSIGFFAGSKSHDKFVDSFVNSSGNFLQSSQQPPFPSIPYSAPVSQLAIFYRGITVFPCSEHIHNTNPVGRNRTAGSGCRYRNAASLKDLGEVWPFRALVV